MRVATLVNVVLRRVFRLRVGRSPSYERRDRVMAMYGPTALLVLLTVWLVLLIVAFMFMYLAVATRSLTTAVELSGSAIFTLGTTSSRRSGRRS